MKKNGTLARNWEKNNEYRTKICTGCGEGIGEHDDMMLCETCVYEAENDNEFLDEFSQYL